MTPRAANEQGAMEEYSVANTFEEQAKERFRKSLAFLQKANALLHGQSCLPLSAGRFSLRDQEYAARLPPTAHRGEPHQRGDAAMARGGHRRAHARF